MPNLDLSILKIMHGDTRVIKVMQGDTKVWPPGFDIEGNLTNVVSSVVLPTSVQMNSSFTTTLSPNISCIITQVSVTMGGVDITSTAYNEGVVTIASVTGDVEITASAIEVITFEDATVKELCVTNWGGNVIAGEITPAEAAQVTTLNSVFYENTNITKFNEFRYFTGITSLYKSGTGDSVFGQFANCSNLVEITIPSSSLSDFRGAFRYTGIVDLDISPTTATTFRIESMVQGRSSGTTALRTVKLPGAKCTGIIRGFRRARGLTTIEIDGTLNLSGISAFTSAFEACISLANITGTIVGIKYNMNFADAPLTRNSALVILNGLDSSSPSHRVIFKASTYNQLTADDIAIATDKGWSVVSG